MTCARPFQFRARLLAALLVLCGAPLPWAAAQGDAYSGASDLQGDEADEGGYIDESELFEDEQTAQAAAPLAPDPLRPVNRAIFSFNDFFYRKALKPVANTYEKVVPRPARRSIGNFFRNLAYPSRLAGNLLQLKFDGAAKETGQFLVNSTAGVGGLFSPAKSMAQLETPKEDVGQAFGAWGLGHGFYLVLPVLGPSSLRDLAGRVGDSAAHPISTPFTFLDGDTERLIIQGVDILNESPDLLSGYESAVEAAFDPYASVKDGYLQRRETQVEE